MTNLIRFALLASTSMLAPIAVNAEVASVHFSSTPLPTTDAERIVPHTTSVATVRYVDGTEKQFPLSWNRLFKNTDSFDGKMVGQVYDAKGNAIMGPDGAPVVAETPDGTTLLQAGGKLYMVSHLEYDWILNDGSEARKAEGWHSRSPMGMIKAELEQGADGMLKAASVSPIDFAGVDGLWIPCAASPSPWGTHLGSEEDYDLYFTAVSGEKEYGKATAGLKALTEQYFGGETQANPYNYGFIPEVSISEDGTASVVKHYAMGRATWEMTQVMPDMRTAYMGDDGAQVFLAMFVADTEKDLSAGTLYGARWNQLSEANGGAATLDWVRLGHATNDEIRAIIDSGVTFEDIFETTTAENAEWEAQGFSRIRAGHSGDEYLKLKPGMEQAAAFLETRRYAAMMGATTEFNKMEGVAADPLQKNLYVAMSYIDKGMKSDPEAPADHIRTAKINAGATYQVPMAGNRKDTTGEAINSDWVGTAMRVPADLLGEDIAPDSMGNSANPEKIANPDNLAFSPAMRTLFIGEDSGTHVNNFVWAYNVDTGILSRILSQPSGSEATGLNVFENVGEYTYIMANNQHQGEWIKTMPEAVSARLSEAADEMYGKNDKGVSNYMLEANFGYIGGLPKF